MSDDEKNYTVDDILSEYDGENNDGQTEETGRALEPLREAEQMESSSLKGSSEKSSSLKKMDEMMSSMRKTGENRSPDKGEEQADASGQEEYDNYEDGEEQDLSEKDFAQEPMFKPAGLFDENTAGPDGEGNSETESGEFSITEGEGISEPEDEDFETEEEIFADEDSEDISGDSEKASDDEQEPLEVVEPEADASEEDIQNENEDGEASGEARTWAENGVPEEITDIDVPEEAEADSGEAEDSKDDGEKNPEKDPEDAAAAEISEEPEDVNDKWLTRFAKGIFPVKGDSVGEVIRKIIFLAALIVFIGAGIMLASTLIQSRLALGDKDKAKGIITTTAASYIDEFGNVVNVAPTDDEIAEHRSSVADYYKKINPDYVGYLEVEGCDIYEPVVQGEDNDKYLKTNISGGYNKAGTVFMDYRCTVSEDYWSPNIVLYGHNQEDGTMFGNLKEYKQNVEFYREHPSVKFSSELETAEYLIYGFFVTHVYASQDSNGEVFHYHDYIETLNNESTFNWYINEVQRRNQIISPVDVEFGDELLCLSTCSNEFTDSRFVVFARKLREGETAADHDFSQAYMNPNAEGVDWDAIITGDPTYSPETEVIDDIEEVESVVTREKSNNKNNSGGGSKSGEPSIAPPPAETAASTVPETETETEKTVETTTSIPLLEGSETDSEQEQEQDSSVTEAPVQEGEQTETAQG